MPDTAAHDAAEVTEEEAQGKIKSTFDDIRTTLRVPFVNLIFRTLAARHPEYLELAWRQIQPNLQTVFFERSADELRRQAVRTMASFGTPPTTKRIHELERVLHTFHYVNPKLLLIACALRSATGGQAPRLQELPPEDKRQIVTGVPRDSAPIAMIDEVTADTRVKEIFNDIRSSLGMTLLNSDYRALAIWPDYLDTAWQSLKPIIDQPGYLQLRRELQRMSDQCIGCLPFRIELNPHTLRHAGLSEADLDSVRSLLQSFYSLLPGLVANISFLTVGIDGAPAAEESPWPLTTAQSS